MSDEPSCPFCDLPPHRVIASNDAALALADAYPIAPGHSLVIPRRHAATWWDLNAAEQSAMWALVDALKHQLDLEHSPTGYNVGFNAGTDAGQTVFHAHLHVIPRYRGDVPDPRGGIRGILPDSSGYLGGAIPAGGRREERLHDGPRNPLLPALADAMERPDVETVDLVVSFVMTSGVELLQRHLDTVLDRCGRVRLLCTDYLGVTEKQALQQMLDRAGEYGERFQVRVFTAGLTSFHAKSYLLGGDDGAYRVAFTGSANVSRPGLTDGYEWTVETHTELALTQMHRAFAALWADSRSEPLTQAFIDAYEPAPRAAGADVAVAAPPVQPYQPTAVQREALAALEQTRQDGFGAGLVVMATGLGKTWLAAFDANRPQFRRVLFVAHREEILTQARAVFRKVRPGASVGMVMGERHEINREVVMATVQTLSRRLDQVEPDAFDYVVVDEFHHAAARSYRSVVNHFDPAFLLGLTATPDRTDAADLLALCENNLVYDCGLDEGIRRQLLSPFRYFGVPDPVDFRPLPWRNARFDPQALEHAVSTEERAQAALREWSGHRGSRTLAFCVSTRHADWMAQAFRHAGVRSAAVHSGATSAPRHESLAALAAAELEVLFTVDMFNEGVDVPAIDTALLLRPTTSPVVFLQQLGRGLRLHPDKEYLTVVDFVGNHRSFLVPVRILCGFAGSSDTASVERALRTGSFALPPGCSVDYAVEAKESLLELLPRARGRLLEALVHEWTAEHGRRPRAAEALAHGVNPASGTGTWFEFLLERGCLADEEARVATAHLPVLRDVARTSMTKSYKMVALRAFVTAQTLRDGMDVAALAERSRRLVLRDPRLVADVADREMSDPALVSPERWAAWWRRWPLEHLVGRGGFELVDDRFALLHPATQADAETLADLILELVDWRMADYLSRGSPDRSVVDVIRNASDRPILMLQRHRNVNLPSERGVPVHVDLGWMTFDFMKVAVNVARRENDEANVLPDLLEHWFGPDVGTPGAHHRVALWHQRDGWHAAPLQAEGAASDSTRSAPS